MWREVSVWIPGALALVAQSSRGQTLEEGCHSLEGWASVAGAGPYGQRGAELDSWLEKEVEVLKRCEKHE